MKNICYMGFKPFCYLIFTISLFSCQSQLDIAGEEHKTAAEKWYALANYTQSDLTKFGVTITAQLSVVEETQTFKLTNFKINNNETRRDINLLAPYFESKFICKSECYQFLEYVNENEVKGETLLSHYFSQHEFQLFKLYGDIVILNESLQNLAKINTPLLPSYLKYLSEQNISFTEPKDFILYLEMALSEKSFSAFLANPKGLYREFLENYNMQPNTGWSNDTNKETSMWSSNEQSEPDYQLEFTLEGEESKSWSSESISPSLKWSTNGKTTVTKDWEVQHSEDALWSNDIGLKEKEVSLWKAAKKLPIVVGQNVCSYEDNFFGVVVSIDNDKVEVLLLGQAKMIKDGVVESIAKGSLFQSNGEFYFFPESGKQIFSTSEVATCYLE